MNWQAVPYDVRRLYIKHAADVRAFDEHEEPELPCAFVDTEIGTILVKRAAPFAKPVADVFDALQKPVGGPNPLTASLVGGALSAGLGYGGGKLVEMLMPRRYMRRGVLPRNLAILGGLAGGGLAGYSMGGRAAVGEQGLSGLLDRKYYPRPATAGAALKQACDKFAVSVAEHSTAYKQADVAGTTLTPIIPVDQFNRRVYNDPYLSPPVQAATMGLTAAASASRGGASLVSPFDVARIAVGMGSGLASGLVVGKVLGALAGITPEAQERLQQAGAFAGLISNVVPGLFSGGR